ncbi:MAG: hypothetical protein CTY18_10725 [Methylomonas sp.]|nr:MAG: hypothetical protein CTY24_12415 [Methylobacter sp.]PPD32284.1 MAG: hypothetical protein CTY18_10725 [Methylomonas sp.]
MLVLRDDQLTLPIADETGFTNWFVDDFMPEFLDDFHQSLPRSRLIQRACYGRNLALRFGFKDPVSHTHFVYLMWEIGPDFFTFPGFKDIAEESSKPEQQRIDAFYQVPAELDKAAMFGSDWHRWEQADNN